MDEHVVVGRPLEISPKQQLMEWLSQKPLIRAVIIIFFLIVILFVVSFLGSLE